MLRTPPFLGRTFTADDAKPGSDVFLIMAHSLWTTYFNSDPGIIGRSITAEGGSITVIGVMPPGFEFPRGYLIWAQFVEDVTQMPRQGRFLGVIGRLKEGVSFEAAESDLQLIALVIEERRIVRKRDAHGFEGLSLFAEIDEVGETEITSLDPGLTIRRPDLDEAVSVSPAWHRRP